MSSAVAFSANDPRPDPPLLLRMPSEQRRPAPRRQPTDEISAKDIFRALRYHSVMFLTLGTLAAVAGAAAGWNLFPTRFTTYALLRIEASAPTLIENSQNSVSRNEFGIVLSTHAGLIKSHKILDRALRKPEVLHLSMLQGLDDPAAFLEEKVVLEFSDKSELVKIAMSGEDPAQIAKIVNSIVDAFFTEVDTFKQEKQARYDKLLRTKSEQEHVLDELTKNYAVQFSKPVSNEARAKTRQGRMFRYAQLLQEESRIKLELNRARELHAISVARLPQVIDEEKRLLQEQEKLQQKQEETQQVKHEEKPPEQAETVAPAIYAQIESDPMVARKYQEILRLIAYIGNYRRTSSEPDSDHIKDYERRLAREKFELEELKRLRFESLKQSFIVPAGGSANQAGHASQTSRMIQMARSSQANQSTQLSQSVLTAQANVTKLQGDIDRLTIDEKAVKEELQGFADLLAEEPPPGPIPEQALAEIRLRTAQEIVSKLELQAKTQKAELEADDRVKLVERAGVPQHREMKRQVAFTGVGGLLGLGLVGSLITVGELRRRRLYGSNDAIFDELPLLGQVPEHGFVRPAAGVEPAPDDLVGVAFREAIDRVKTLVLKSMIPTRAQTLLVTSPAADEGKSILAWNLAAGMARTDYRVLFIDANFHAPSIHKHLEVPMPEGLAEVLRGERSLSEVLLRTPLVKLSALAAGAVDDDARRALDRGAMQRLLERARREFDFVVIDGCALAEGVDPLYLAQRVDAAIVSLRTYRSCVPAIEQSVKQLKLLGTNVLGAVLTDPTMRQRPRNEELIVTKQFVTYLIVIAVVCVGTVAHGVVTGRWTSSSAPDYKLPEIPMKFGDWSGEDAKTDMDDPRLRNLTRSYAHTRTGRQLTVSLTVGPAGLNAQHTPEYCYPGSGFQLVGQSQDLTPAGRTDTLRTAVYRKQLGGATESIRILWGWTTAGAWTAPRHPELSYFGRAPLYKLYVVSDAVEGDPSADALLQSFVAELMTSLRIGN